MSSMTEAAFLIIPHGGLYAAVTRDTGDAPLGLPGGKVEPGESPLEAALREAREEGWRIVYPRYAQVIEVWRAEVDGTLVRWIYIEDAEAKPLRRYKEQRRGIRPTWAAADELRGLGNGVALRVFRRKFGAYI